jgi:4-hydroxybenzoate polyprenyltransferase
MHSAGCAINDVADVRFDRQVRRTKDRPLASGEVGPTEAMVIALGLVVIAFMLIWHLNLLTKKLAVIALVLTATYPWFKRFFAMPQAYLGIAFGFGIPMAFAAVQGEVPTEAWFLMLSNVFWTLAYDTQYAMADREDDLKIGMRTSAITLGKFDVAGVMLFHAMMLTVFFLVGRQAGLGVGLYAGLLCAALGTVFQYRLIKTRDPEKCLRAFHYNNWTGLVLYAGIWLDYALL